MEVTSPGTATNHHSPTVHSKEAGACPNSLQRFYYGTCLEFAVIYKQWNGQLRISQMLNLPTIIYKSETVSLIALHSHWSANCGSHHVHNSNTTSVSRHPQSGIALPFPKKASSKFGFQTSVTHPCGAAVWPCRSTPSHLDIRPHPRCDPHPWPSL